MIKFSHARTALKFGLMSLKIEQNDEILIPSYNCDAVIMPINELKIKYKFYDIDNSLSPIWENVENLLSKNTKAILMVNYFGQPQKIEDFLSFAKKNSLFLIEDNAHGHGGTYKGCELGQFGDIGISSPKKLINLYSGGILYSKSPFKIDIDNLDHYPVSKTYINIRKFFNNKPKLKNTIKKILFSQRPKHEDPFYYKTPKIKDYKIDKFSEKEFNNTKWNQVKSIKQKNYYLWQEFSLKNNLRPVFKELNSGSIPWCFPVYLNNSADAIKWFKWGWKKNLIVFSWPTLPSELINNNSNSFKLLKKIVCFSTHNSIL